MQLRKHVTAIAMLALAAVLGACDGDNGGPSKATCLARANRICAALNEERQQAAVSFFPSQTEPPTVQQYQAFLRSFLPTFGKRTGEVFALEVPKGDGPIIAQMRAEQEKVVSAFRRATTDAGHAQELLATDEAVTTELSRMADAYGLKVCAGTA